MAGFGCSPRHKTSPPFCDLRCRCFPAPASPERKTSNTRLGLAGRVSSDDPSDRKSTRLNSSHLGISYAVFCLKKQKNVILKASLSLTDRTRTRLSSTHLGD